MNKDTNGQTDNAQAHISTYGRFSQPQHFFAAARLFYVFGSMCAQTWNSVYFFREPKLAITAFRIFLLILLFNGGKLFLTVRLWTKVNEFCLLYLDQVLFSSDMFLDRRFYWTQKGFGSQTEIFKH